MNSTKPDWEPAPVALFAYARLEHLRTTVNSLQKNAEARVTQLHVFCDAASRPEHNEGVLQVREFAERISGFASVQVHRRASNLGLARSIIDGVSQLTASHGRVIVVEDDLLLSRHFLRYMNEALECYALDSIVASIHGYCYPVADSLPETFFLRGADCWGWATWSRAWSHFNPDGSDLLRQIRARGLTRRFDFDGSYAYTRMLRDQIAGRNDSWAVRWHASAFLKGMLTLYPGRSLVHNTGNDDSGTHCDRRIDYAQQVASNPVAVHRLPLTENAAARASFIRFFESARPGALERLRRIGRRLAKGLR